MSKKRILTLAVVALFALFAANAAFAASLSISQFVFNPNERGDVLGESGKQGADGKADGSFTVSFAGANAIKEIILKNDADGKTWSSNDTSSFILITGSDGSAINASGRLLVLPVVLGAKYNLFISDIDSVVTKDTPFTVTARLVDDTSISATTTAKPSKDAVTAPPATTTPAAPAAEDGITDAKSYATSDFDLAGTGKSVGADGKKDVQIDAKFNFKDTTVKNIKVTATAGNQSVVWDTVSGNNNPLIVVVDGSKNIVSKTDGTVSIPVKGTAAYTLLVQDNANIFANANVKATLTISLSDGRIFEKAIAKGAVTAAANSMLAEYKGTGKYDFVGTNEKMGSNLNPDHQLDVSVNASGTITGIRVRSDKTKKTWDTIDGNGNSLVAVTNAKGERLNKQDGSVSIPLSGAANFSLWFEEEADNSPYLVTFVLSNGQVIEAATKAAAASDQKTDPKTPVKRDVTFLTAKPAVVKVDLVGKNKKPAGNGAQDTSVKVEINGNGKIVAMTLADSSSMGWDTLTSNNGRWLLGVREGAKLLNKADGTINIQIQGSKTLELLMQDNGKLRAATGNLTLSITWGNGKVTTSQLVW